MIPHGNDNESGRKHVTVLHLIYRIVNGKFQNFGLFETRRAAEKDLAVINRQSGGWQITEVPCLADLLGGRTPSAPEDAATAHPAGAPFKGVAQWQGRHKEKPVKMD